MKRLWWLLVVIVFLVIIDQITKGMVDQSFYLHESIPVIDGFFNLTYVRNTGAAWGFGATAGPWIRLVLFKVIPVFAVFFLFYLLIKSLKESLHMSVAYALIIAGAIGNLIDRFVLGFVVDFFDFYVGGSHFPAFNIADSCITVAAFIIGYDALVLERKKRKES